MTIYPLLQQAHYWLSRTSLLIAVIMLVIAIIIGLVRHGDVTPVFRRTTYAIVGLMLVQMLLGVAMIALGGQPGEEVHLIYGAGATLALPFFVYVERTARKRPAMGSYIWGFGMLAAIVLRAIMTGAR